MFDVIRDSMVEFDSRMHMCIFKLQISNDVWSQLARRAAAMTTASKALLPPDDCRLDRRQAQVALLEHLLGGARLGKARLVG